MCKRNLLFACILLIQIYYIVSKITVDSSSTKKSGAAKILFSSAEPLSDKLKAQLSIDSKGRCQMVLGEGENPKEASGIEITQDSLNLLSDAEIKYMSVTDSIVFEGMDPKSKKKTYQKDWTLAYQETFETDQIFWDRNNFKIDKCTNYEDHFLLHDCNSPFSEIYYILNILPDHSEVKVNFNFHFIDDWSNQQAYLKVDNQVKWTEAYHWCSGPFQNNCMKQGVDTCGNSYPDKIGSLVSYTGMHYSKSLNFTVGTNIAFQECGPKWGVDNIEIFVR